MARACAVSNEPSLSTAVRPWLAIPELFETYRLGQEASSCHFLVDFLGEDDMAVLIDVVHVFIGILDFLGVVRH